MPQKLDLILVADSFLPKKTSAAIQLRDLCVELKNQGHNITVALPSSEIKNHWKLTKISGIKVLLLKCFRSHQNYIYRTLSEIFMPILMLKNYKKSIFIHKKWDGIIWYSPSIFHGLFINFLQKKSKSKTYLILRDIFPNWINDIGLISKGIPYYFFLLVARYQYSLADVIGVQSKGNLKYFNFISKYKKKTELEVLNNWLSYPQKPIKSKIKINKTKLSGRKIAIYIGNIGVAQDLEIFLRLAQKLNHRLDIGFLFVGRGDEKSKLINLSNHFQLNNTLFYNEVDNDELTDLLSQCHIGVISLHHLHRTHNIPGKFLTYLQNGLPVIANINKGNDLSKIIKLNNVGMVCESNDLENLKKLFIQLLNKLDKKNRLKNNCLKLFREKYLVKKAVDQITSNFINE